MNIYIKNEDGEILAILHVNPTTEDNGNTAKVSIRVRETNGVKVEFNE